MKAEPIGLANELNVQYENGVQLEKMEFPVVELEEKLGGETLGNDQEFVFHTQRCKTAAVTSAKEPMKNFK